jgi:hypothetical protein
MVALHTVGLHQLHKMRLTVAIEEYEGQKIQRRKRLNQTLFSPELRGESALRTPRQEKNSLQELIVIVSFTTHP